MEEELQTSAHGTGLLMRQSMECEPRLKPVSSHVVSFYWLVIKQYKSVLSASLEQHELITPLFGDKYIRGIRIVCSHA